MNTDAQKLNDVWKSFSELLKRGDTKRYPPFFFDYNKHLTDEALFHKHVMNAAYLFQLAKRPVAGQRILDVGCGFGITCAILAALGAREVHGMDYNPQWVKAIDAYLKELKWDFPIETRTGDASELPYDSGSMDVLLSVEAISHYHDVESFFAEAGRVLTDGGILVISDANNGANPKIRKETYQVWSRFENGPPTDDFHGHPIRKSFRQMREEIIGETFPKLSETDRRTLAENTFGMGREEIVEKCKTFVRDGILPDCGFRHGVPAFNPVMNDYIERLFRPRDLAWMLEKNGFRVKIHAHFGGAGARNLIGRINALFRLFTPVTIPFAPGYKIVAVKN